MANPVVHFEIIGPDPDGLRSYYAALFGWDAPAGAPVAAEVSDQDAYSFIDTSLTGDAGIPGGIGGGPEAVARATFYVGVRGCRGGARGRRAARRNASARPRAQ